MEQRIAWDDLPGPLKQAIGPRTTPHEAEQQASRLPAFRAADPAHIDLFADANVRLWDEIAQASASDWTVKMAQAAQSWAAYRHTH